VKVDEFGKSKNWQSASVACISSMQTQAPKPPITTRHHHHHSHHSPVSVPPCPEPWLWLPLCTALLPGRMSCCLTVHLLDHANAPPHMTHHLDVIDGGVRGRRMGGNGFAAAVSSAPFPQRPPNRHNNRTCQQVGSLPVNCVAAQHPHRPLLLQVCYNGGAVVCGGATTTTSLLLLPATSTTAAFEGSKPAATTTPATTAATTPSSSVVFVIAPTATPATIATLLPPTPSTAATAATLVPATVALLLTSSPACCWY